MGSLCLNVFVFVLINTFYFCLFVWTFFVFWLKFKWQLKASVLLQCWESEVPLNKWIGDEKPGVMFELKLVWREALRPGAEREYHRDSINTHSLSTDTPRCRQELGTVRQYSRCVSTRRPCQLLFTLITLNMNRNFPFLSCRWRTEASSDLCATFNTHTNNQTSGVLFLIFFPL